jgi:hypothetical protein
MLTTGCAETSFIMTPERASRLFSLGFVWEARHDPNVDVFPWNVRFQQLKELQERFGATVIPDMYKVGRWRLEGLYKIVCPALLQCPTRYSYSSCFDRSAFTTAGYTITEVGQYSAV